MESAADTRVKDDAPPPADPARAHLRDLIRQEVAARRPRPIARRTLELLTESAVEPAPGAPAYRVVDRRGEPRLREVEGAPAEPLTLAEFVSELETRHPGLFEPPLPEPVAALADSPVAAETASAQAAKLRDDATRYIELQSAKARVVTRAVAARSSARGRTLAASAGATYAALRAKATGLTSRAPATAPTPAIDGATYAALRAKATGLTSRAPATAPTPAIDGATPATAQPTSSQSVPLGDRLRGRAGDAVARGRDVLGQANDLLDGRWILGSATAAAVLVAAVVLVGTAHDNPDAPPAKTPSLPSRDVPAGAPASPPASQPGAQQAPSQASPGDQESGASPPSSGSAQPVQETQTGGATPPPEEEADLPTPAPGDLSGPAEVVDTATLKVGGKVLRLFGVEWVRGGQPQDLTRYLAGRPVSCQRAPGSENYLCQVEGRDLSEVVLFNGGGRASPEASPDLVAAEDHARTERLGVWKR